MKYLTKFAVPVCKSFVAMTVASSALLGCDGFSSLSSAKKTAVNVAGVTSSRSGLAADQETPTYAEGTIDSVSGSQIFGWACTIITDQNNGYTGAIFHAPLKLYLGDARTPAPGPLQVDWSPSETAVNQRCAAFYGGYFRFTITLDEGTREKYQGQTIAVGFDPAGGAFIEDLIGNAGVFRVPAPTTSDRSRGIIQLFQAMLGENPDTATLNQYLYSGWDLGTIQNQIAFSPAVANLINIFFNSYLGRSPRADEMMANQVLLATTAEGYAGIRARIIASVGSDYVAQVTEAYRTILLREPDAAGLNAWVANLQNGYPVPTMYNLIRQSDEARALFARQITDVAHATLGRDLNSYELNAWIANMVNGYTKDQVLAAFQQTDEALTLPYKQQIAEAYRAILLREPDSAGLTAWATNMKNGYTIDQVRSALRSSAEAKAIDAQQITDIAHATLGRDLTSAELGAWITNMVNGYNKDQVYVAFRNAEFTRDVTDTYRSMLLRAPEPAGLQQWIAAMTSGLTLFEFQKGIANSQEARDVGVIQMQQIIADFLLN